MAFIFFSKCKHGRDWRDGAAVAVVGELVEPQAMERKRNPGKPLNNGLLAIFLLGFCTALRLGSGTGLFLEHLVCNVKNGKVFFIGSKSTTKKVPQKNYELIIVVGKVVQFL